MTVRSTLRLVLLVLTIIFAFVVLYVLIRKASAGEFHLDVAASTLFLYIGAMVAVVLSAAAGVRGGKRFWFHAILGVITVAVAIWWFTSVQFPGSTTAGIFAVVSIAITLAADALSETPPATGPGDEPEEEALERILASVRADRAASGDQT
ncbi:hypothetical protein [Blastococcus sp. SYSU DS0616]